MSLDLLQRIETKPGLDRVLADFVAQSWEREVALLPGATAAPFVSEADIFSALVEAPTLPATDGNASDYVVWIGGRVEPRPRDYAALPADGTLRGYLARMSESAGNGNLPSCCPIRIGSTARCERVSPASRGCLPLIPAFHAAASTAVSFWAATDARRSAFIAAR